jgi:hypothetical protein
VQAAGLRCGVAGGAQQAWPHGLGAVVHQNQLDAVATGTIYFVFVWKEKN